MASLPPGIDVNTGNFRYITIDGITSLDKGLVMSGNTPLFVKNPRRKTMDIDGMHGTIDISWQKGQLYYDNRILKYNFALFVPRYDNDSLEDINLRCENEIISIHNWCNRLDGSGNSMLLDSGAGRFFEVKLESINAEKTFKVNTWVLTIELEFRAHPEMVPIYFTYPTTSDIKTALDTVQYQDGRSFSYGSLNTSDLNLYISGPTALEEPPIKHKLMELPFRNGNADLGLYYGDDTIAYRCILILDNQGTRNDMNAKCQAATEYIMNLLYGATDATEHAGIQMKGTATLTDSALGTFYFARCTGFGATKSMTDSYWIVSFNITFTTYPKIISDGWNT